MLLIFAHVLWGICSFIGFILIINLESSHYTPTFIALMAKEKIKKSLKDRETLNGDFKNALLIIYFKIKKFSLSYISIIIIYFSWTSLYLYWVIPNMKELFIYFVLDLVITGVYGIFLIRTFFITSTFVRFLRTFKKAMNKNEIGKENIIHFQKEINDNFDDLKDVQISFFVKRYVWKHKTLFMLSFGMLYDYYGTDFVMIMPIILKDIDNPQSIYFSFYHQEVINFYKELKN